MVFQHALLETVAKDLAPLAFNNNAKDKLVGVASKALAAASRTFAARLGAAGAAAAGGSQRNHSSISIVVLRSRSAQQGCRYHSVENDGDDARVLAAARAAQV